MCTYINKCACECKSEWMHIRIRCQTRMYTHSRTCTHMRIQLCMCTYTDTHACLTSSKKWPLLNESPHQCSQLCTRHVTRVHESLDIRQGYTSPHRLSHSHTRPPTSPPTSPHNNASVSHPFSLSFPPLCPLLSLSPPISLSHVHCWQVTMHYAYTWVISRVCMRHVTYKNESSHTYEWGMPHCIPAHMKSRVTCMKVRLTCPLLALAVQPVRAKPFSSAALRCGPTDNGKRDAHPRGQH